jgi:hypothetical protein
MSEKPSIMEDEHDQDHNDGGLEAPKEDEHNQNHNNKVGPTSNDNYQEEDYDGRRTWTYI